MSLKKKLIAYCKDWVTERISVAQVAMDHAQAAANEEGKSSAGDKYETGRAMMQIERDKAAHQLAEALKLKQLVDGLLEFGNPDEVRVGAIVQTTHYHFFVAISVGKISLDGVDYLLVSPLSPIGKLLLSKKMGDSITFNQSEERILRIE
jgi:transcription elongation GreA/GreB family factor